MSNDQFVRKRIKELRLGKKISEHQMSLDLGKSKGYIQSIVSGRALPRMGEFFAICDYLDVTPRGFFESDIERALASKVADRVQKLDGNKLKAVKTMLDLIDKE